jgi:membrane protein
MDWVGRLEEEGDARYVLLCDPALTAARPLLSQMLLHPVPAMQLFWQRAGFGQMSLQDLLDT